MGIKVESSHPRGKAGLGSVRGFVYFFLLFKMSLTVRLGPGRPRKYLTDEDKYKAHYKAKKAYRQRQVQIKRVAQNVQAVLTGPAVATTDIDDSGLCS